MRRSATRALAAAFLFIENEKLGNFVWMGFGEKIPRDRSPTLYGVKFLLKRKKKQQVPIDFMPCTVAHCVRADLWAMKARRVSLPGIRE